MNNKRIETLLVMFVLVGMLAIVIKQGLQIRRMRADYTIAGRDIAKGQLHDSLFNLKTELGRYETTLDILKERDSTAASKFEEILYTETE